MEPDEIGVVLARASELHSKISDAIERALKTEFLLSTSGRSPSNRDLENAAASPTSEGKSEGRRYSESDVHDRSALGVDGSAEARSLGAIRDALEVLEDQLEALQTVQNQQRTEKDAALAELEESRRILLKRLKEHRGREWEIVHDALAFAGEPVEDRDDLPLPPYPRPLSDVSGVEGQSPPYHGSASMRPNVALKRFSLGSDHHAENANYVGEPNGRETNHLEDDSGRQKQSSNTGGGLLGIPFGIARAIFGHAYGFSRKAAIVVLSVAAALAVSELSQRMEKKKMGSNFIPKRPTAPPPIATARQLPPTKECPPGKKLIMEDSYPKCVVKERVELPFPKEISTPDVLYGRG